MGERCRGCEILEERVRALEKILVQREATRGPIAFTLPGDCRVLKIDDTLLIDAPHPKTREERKASRTIEAITGGGKKVEG